MTYERRAKLQEEVSKGWASQTGTQSPGHSRARPSCVHNSGDREMVKSDRELQAKDEAALRDASEEKKHLLTGCATGRTQSQQSANNFG
jgi:hypothetical protein